MRHDNTTEHDGEDLTPASVGVSVAAQDWDGDAFRRIDGSMGSMLRESVFMIGGASVAYLVARVICERFLGLGSSPADIGAATAIHVVLFALSIYFSSGRPIMADIALQRSTIAANEAAMLERVAQQSFIRDVQDALEMSETEGDALDVAGDAMSEALPGPAELLLADASRAHLRRAASAPGVEPPGCGVETPWGCPAVRRGRTLVFERSDQLGACPRLRDRGGEPCSAVCVPITILGTPTAVMHATGPVAPDTWDHETIDRLEGVAVQVGTRLGVLRAMTKSQLQAETDPLTGLLNRRAMEERVRALRQQETPFALAMADLDHFKRLNDAFGHETGDRALRSFAHILRESVRDADVVARHGGEEFVIVLPGLDALAAMPILHRIREQLRENVGNALLPAFTVSMGVADSTCSPLLSDVLRAADNALLQAKTEGRDRLVIADLPAGDAEPVDIPT